MQIHYRKPVTFKMKRLAIIAAAALALSACSGKTDHHFADLDLVGYYHNEPRVWTAERFAPHVSYVDSKGVEHWLFEAFLFTEIRDVKRGVTLCIAPEGHSATKESWADQIAMWLGPDGAVAELEKACASAAGRIGAPSRKRQIIISVPDAIMLENFADKSSATRYWGSVDGVELDFVRVDDQLAAYKWYIDTVRQMFEMLDCKYVELAGFDILSEDLPVVFGETPIERFNCTFKRWSTILPAVSEYCHANGEIVCWIGYHLAPGCKYWESLGIDMAWMQPNFYWDLSDPGRHPMDVSLEAIKEYSMGMELEFEYSMVEDVMKEAGMGPDISGRLVFTPEDVPALRHQFRTYMSSFKEAGLYGTAPLALYSGSNALTQLACSPCPEDHELYIELCDFISGNPLRHE